MCHMMQVMYREIHSAEEDREKRSIYTEENKKRFLRGNFVLFNMNQETGSLHSNIFKMV